MDANNYKIRLAGIDVLQKHLAPRPLQGIGSVFTFNMKVEIKVNAEKRLLMPLAEIGISEENKTDILFSITTACIFEIQDFNEHIHLAANGRFDIPPDLERLLRDTVLSTSRGLIFCELKATYLQNAILPVIFSSQFSTAPPQAVN